MADNTATSPRATAPPPAPATTTSVSESSSTVSADVSSEITAEPAITTATAAATSTSTPDATTTLTGDRGLTSRQSVQFNPEVLVRTISDPPASGTAGATDDNGAASSVELDGAFAATTSATSATLTSGDGDNDDDDGVATDQPPPAVDAPLAPRDAAADIDAQLAQAKELVPYMAEAGVMANHVLKHINALRTHASRLQDDEAEALCGIARQYVAFLRKFAGEPIGAYRLVHHPAIAAQIKATHHALDSLARGANIAVYDWKSSWTACWNVQLADFKAMSRERQLLLSGQNLTDDAKVSLVQVVQYENNRAKAVYLPAWCDVLQAASNSLLQLTNSVSRVVGSWFLPKQDITLQGILSRQGAFADVHYAMYLGTLVVAKVPKLHHGELDKAAFVEEANMWFRANKVPNVIRFFGACHIGTEQYFVSEYAANGTLMSYLSLPTNKSRTWSLLLQAAHGLRGLHQLGIYHNDLKCNNILVTKDGVAKLTDFGLSSATIAAKAVGAFAWKAPEVIAGTHSDTPRASDDLVVEDRSPDARASDIYSFGMCIVEAVGQRAPWGTASDAYIRLQVVENCKLPKRPSGFTNEQWALVKAMCEFDPKDRLCLDDVILQLQKFTEDEFNMQHQCQMKKLNLTLGELPEQRPSGFTDDQWKLMRAMYALEPTDELRMDDVLDSLKGLPDDNSTQHQSQVEQHGSLARSGIAELIQVSSQRVAAQQCGDVAHQAESEAEHDGVGRSTAPAALNPNRSASVKRQDAPVRPSAAERSASTASPAPHASDNADNTVNDATVDDYRFVTIGRREVVEYRVAVRLKSGREAVVWKRFSHFRYVHKHLKQDTPVDSSPQEHLELVRSLRSFPHRAPLWSSRSQAMIEQRRAALETFLASVVSTSGLPLGIRLSDTEVVYKRGTKPKFVL